MSQITLKQKGCMGCVIYQLSCDSVEYYKEPKTKSYACVNCVHSIENEKNPIQVQAFYFIHRNLQRQGVSPEDCLVQAVCATSDDVFDKFDDKTLVFMKAEFDRAGKELK